MMNLWILYIGLQITSGLKKNEIILIKKDGSLDIIEKLPNMRNVFVFDTNLYKYNNVIKEEEGNFAIISDAEIEPIVVCEGEEIPFNIDCEWWDYIASTDKGHPVIRIKISEDRYKLMMIKNGTFIDISDEYYELDVVKFDDDKCRYLYAREIRENGQGGFYTILNTEGEEVITREAKIVSIDDDSCTVRIDHDNETEKSINWFTLQLYDEEELREAFLKNLNSLRS
ncbi:MAG TPA: hypothetical protein GX392_02010 [Clostridiales bacterium]|nr:hypothetical protein [Clostridiales bacterium]